MSKEVADRFFQVIKKEWGHALTTMDVAFMADLLASNVSDLTDALERVNNLCNELPHASDCALRFMGGIYCDCWIAEVRDAVRLDKSTDS